MAIEAMKKMTVIAHREVAPALLDTLQALGTVDVRALSGDERVESGTLGEREVAEFRRCTLTISHAEFVLSFFREHGFVREGFLRTMVREKHRMTLREFREIEERVDLETVYAECSEFSRRLAKVAEEKSGLERERGLLEAWTGLEIDMNEIHEEHMYALLPVEVPNKALGELLEGLEKRVPLSHLDVVSRNGGRDSCVLVLYPASRPDAEALLLELGLEPAELPDRPMEPAERLEQVEREITGLDRRRDGLLAAAKGCARNRREIEVLREYLVNERKKIEVSAGLGSTRSAVVLEGWVAESGMPATVRALKGLSEELAVELSEPDEEELPPVSLRNARWARPFELLTRLYGMPRHGEHDPTALIAVSFAIFAGFCIADVGYGLLLIIAFTLMRRFMPLGNNVKDLLVILTYAAGMAMVFGALSGSWFTIDPDRLPKFLNDIAVIDMLRKPLPVMGLAMALGLVHMLTGTAVEFRDNVREGNLASALIDQGLVFLFFAGLGAALPLLLTKALPSWAAIAVAGVPVLLMLLLFGRESKSIAGKAVNGLYETYNTVVGWMGDTISYVRLYALGLATFIIGWVVNTLGGMVMGIGPVIGIALMALLILVGHTFNVTINLLGAFVHPLRLEYVEFFGKFYEDGGGKFEPLRIESGTVLIEEESA